MSQAESPSLMKAAFIRALSPAMRMSDAVRISSGILEGMKLGNLISLRDAEKIPLKNSSATEGSNVRSWRILPVGPTTAFWRSPHVPG